MSRIQAELLLFLCLTIILSEISSKKSKPKKEKKIKEELNYENESRFLKKIKKNLKRQPEIENEIPKQEKPKVTVIIPIRNKIKFALYSLRSVQMQSIENIEIIIADYGSSHANLQLFYNKAKIDKRIEILPANRSVTGSFYQKVEAIKKARGEFLMFLHPGNALTSPYALKKLIKVGEKTESDLIHFQKLTSQFKKLRLSLQTFKDKDELSLNKKKFVKRVKDEIKIITSLSDKLFVTSLFKKAVENLHDELKDSFTYGDNSILFLLYAKKVKHYQTVLKPFVWINIKAKPNKFPKKLKKENIILKKYIKHSLIAVKLAYTLGKKSAIGRAVFKENLNQAISKDRIKVTKKLCKKDPLTKFAIYSFCRKYKKEFEDAEKKSLKEYCKEILINKTKKQN